MDIIERPSPNHGPRPAGVAPSLIVLHGTAGTTDAGDISWLTQRESGVSYHYLVARTGKVYRLVADHRRAWHAGESTWLGRPNVNDYSLGIGLSNNGQGERYTDAQYRATGELLRELMRRWNIGLAGVVGHYHISPNRKADPYTTFEWGRAFGHAVAP